jgi:integrase/recombinase XerD
VLVPTSAQTDPGKTYWYLEAAPELMELAGERLERHLGAGR